MTPAWLTIALRELIRDVRELPGAQQHNPRIVAYHASTTLHATDDETPWCSSFVNWCVTQAGLVGTHSAAAASWVQWGRVSHAEMPGTIVVLKRTGGHHVGFLIAGIDEHVLLLGGNQGNRVSIAPFARERVVAMRWAA